MLYWFVLQLVNRARDNAITGSTYNTVFVGFTIILQNFDHFLCVQFRLQVLLDDEKKLNLEDNDNNDHDDDENKSLNDDSEDEEDDLLTYL